MPACLTCDRPDAEEYCWTCGTPAGGPVVDPGMRTYGVTRLGVAVVVGLLAVLLVRRAHRAVSAARTLDGLGGSGPVRGRPAGRLRTDRAGQRGASDHLDGARPQEPGRVPGAAPGWSADWAIAGWFIPCANIVLPFLVMAGIARSSLIRARTRPWIALWWIAYVGAGVLWNAGGALADQRESDAVIWDHREYYASALTGNVISTALLAVATFALATLVVRIGRAQEARIGRARWHAAVSVQPPDGADATIGP